MHNDVMMAHLLFRFKIGHFNARKYYVTLTGFSSQCQNDPFESEKINGPFQMAIWVIFDIHRRRGPTVPSVDS